MLSFLERTLKSTLTTIVEKLTQIIQAAKKLHLHLEVQGSNQTNEKTTQVIKFSKIRSF